MAIGKASKSVSKNLSASPSKSEGKGKTGSKANLAGSSTKLGGKGKSGSKANLAGSQGKSGSKASLVGSSTKLNRTTSKTGPGHLSRSGSQTKATKKGRPKSYVELTTLAYYILIGLWPITIPAMYMSEKCKEAEAQDNLKDAIHYSKWAKILFVCSLGLALMVGAAVGTTLAAFYKVFAT